MIPISDDFRTELQQQIRRPGHCFAYLSFDNAPRYTIPEYLIKSVSFHTTGDPLTRRMPTEECNLVLTDYERLWDAGNPNGLYESASEGRTKITLQFGIEDANSTTLWTDEMVFILDQKPTWANYEARFHFVRKLTLWNDEAEAGSSAQTNLKERASALWRQTYKNHGWGYYNFDVASILENIPIISHCGVKRGQMNVALMNIAVAGVCSLRTSYDGNIEIKQHWLHDAVRNYSTITAMDMLETPTMERLPLIRKEIAKYKKNPMGTQTSKVLASYKGTELPTGNNMIWIDLSEVAVIGSVSTGDFVNMNELGYVEYNDHIEVYSVTKINQNRNFSFNVYGIPAAPAIRKRIYTVDANGTDDEELEDNDLFNASNVTAGAGAASVLAYRGNYLKKTRDLYSIKYRGDPSIEAYDIIRVELPFYGVSSCIVLDQTFTFQNGFSGTLIVRRISDPADTQAFDNVPATDNTVPVETD